MPAKPWISFQPGSSSFFADYGINGWLAVLRLAVMWDFPAVRELALDYIGSMNLAYLDLAVIGYAYPIPPLWWHESLAHFVGRDEPISPDEAEDIGARLTALLFTAREILGEERRKNEDYVSYVVCGIFEISLDDE
jgi:hypothetical protein